MKNSLVYILLIFLLNLTVLAQKSGFRPVFADSAMVVTADKYANESGLKVLKKGGNAVDAAIAISATLAVTYPYAGNLGGGGFMLICDDKGTINSIDFREKAPQNAKPDMYLDSSGEVKKNESLIGYKAAGVPGTVAGLWAAHEKFGKLEWETLFEDAIDLAEKGFILDRYNALLLKKYAHLLEKFESTKKIFFKEEKPYQGIF